VVVLPLILRLLENFGDVGGMAATLGLVTVVGVALAYLDRLFPARRVPIGLCALGALFVEETGAILYAVSNGDEKALPLIWIVAFVFAVIAVVYGMTRAGFLAWPQGSKSQ
jgi:lysylphosphatidylglycerol synthetase-like protein (DUF2156 family)